MVKVELKRSNQPNLFSEINSKLTTDEFVYEHKQAILKSPKLMRLFFYQYRPYLYKAARQVMRTYSSLELDALVNEGFEGMLRALKKYDCKYASFLTYAQYWINMKMYTYVQKSFFHIALPGGVFSIVGKYKQLKAANPKITNLELCMELGVTEKKLEVIKQAALLQNNIKSLNTELMLQGESNNTPVDLSDLASNKIMAADIDRILSEVLTEKECYVVKSLFGMLDGKPKVLERVGKVLSVSKERVRQIKEYAFEQLRESGALRDFI